MLSVLVCHSYFMRFDPKQRERAKPYPPLATLQAASLLRLAGHEVSLFDAMLAEGIADYKRVLRDRRPDVVLLYEDNYNFLTKMCLAKMREAACEMITLAHRSGARVIASGSDARHAPEPYLTSGADLVLVGEGLVTLLELLPRLARDPTVPCSTLVVGLSGVTRLENSRVAKVNDAAVLPESRLRGFPAWDLVDMDRYREVWERAHGYFSLNMVASRGCPFRCTWCAKPIWGNQYLQRTPVEVAAEMTHLKRLARPDHVWFADDIFGFRADWVEEFARELKASSGGVPFTIQTRADLISERMALALREAGCREAWIGAESGSQRVLDAMHKGTTVAEIITARERLKAAGIRVGFFIQLGYLGEELPDIVATRELLDVARPDDVGVSVAYPLPGTKFYELVKEQLRSKTHWQDSDDLAMMFRGTYHSEFYREIRNLIHDQVRLSQSLEREAQTQDLNGRWESLLALEPNYRAAGDSTAARP